MAYWDTLPYQRIAHARWCPPMTIEVEFEDGATVQVDGTRLLPPETRTPIWERLSWSPYELAIPTVDDVTIIPSNRVRLLTDHEYAAHWARMAEQQARKVGERIRALRKARGLTGKELAKRAGIAPQSLSRIEHGQHDVVLTTLQALLAAMGCELRDLATPDPDEVPSEASTIPASAG
jgi:DNA-binding XRE family transcriptional regulator